MPPIILYSSWYQEGSRLTELGHNFLRGSCDQAESGIMRDLRWKLDHPLRGFPGDSQGIPGQPASQGEFESQVTTARFVPISPIRWLICQSVYFVYFGICNVYIYMYMYMYIYVYTYMYMYIYIYIILCTFLAFLVSSQEKSAKSQEKSAKSPRQVVHLPKQRWIVDDIFWRGQSPTLKIGKIWVRLKTWYPKFVCFSSSSLLIWQCWRQRLFSNTPMFFWRVALISPAATALLSCLKFNDLQSASKQTGFLIVLCCSRCFRYPAVGPLATCVSARSLFGIS